VGLPPRFTDLAEVVAFGRRWQADLAADRMGRVTWPTAYGGRGLGPTEHFVVKRSWPGPGPRAGGTDRHQPGRTDTVGPRHRGPETAVATRPCSGPTELWCQLFSEPDAGSDLASLTTVATAVAGGWVLNGQKVWTSYAQFADWGVCAWPAATPTPPSASRVCPVWSSTCTARGRGTTAGPDHRRGRVQRGDPDDAFVPDPSWSARKGAGWTVANSTLSHERGVNPRQLGSTSAPGGASRTGRRPRPGLDDWDVRQRIWPRPTSRSSCSSSTTGAP
jgi:alkylation response protein AidB-like acyl-CoA dehydrogenase